jgi:hypothetical protein
VSEKDVLMALAADLVEEIAAARALELAAGTVGGGTAKAQPAAAPAQPIEYLEGAAAVHPHLGGHLIRLPGGTISELAFKHVHTAAGLAAQQFPAGPQPNSQP